MGALTTLVQTLLRPVQDRLARRLGYRLWLEPLSRLEPVDLRWDGNDWSALSSQVDFQPVLIHAAMLRGRDLGGLSFAGNRHPLVVATWRALSSTEPSVELRETPQRFEMAIGLGAAATGDRGRPWSETGDAASARPVPAIGSEAAVIRRLEALIHRAEGANEFDDPCWVVTAEALMLRDGRWWWLPDTEDARCRAAVLAAMGRRRLTLEIRRVVLRDHAAAWPGVLAGRFSEREARAIFDGLVESAVAPRLGRHH